MIDLVAFISYAAGSFRTNAFGINDAFVDRRSLCMQHNKQTTKTTCLDGGRICVAESALLTIKIQQMLVENKRFYYFCSFSMKKPELFIPSNSIQMHFIYKFHWNNRTSSPIHRCWSSFNQSITITKLFTCFGLNCNMNSQSPQTKNCPPFHCECAELAWTYIWFLFRFVCLFFLLICTIQLPIVVVHVSFVWPKTKRQKIRFVVGSLVYLQNFRFGFIDKWVRARDLAGFSYHNRPANDCHSKPNCLCPNRSDANQEEILVISAQIWTWLSQ